MARLTKFHRQLRRDVTRPRIPRTRRAWPRRPGPPAASWGLEPSRGRTPRGRTHQGGSKSVLAPCRTAIRAVRALPALLAGQAACRGQPPLAHRDFTQERPTVYKKPEPVLAHAELAPRNRRSATGPPWSPPRDPVLCPPPRPPSHSTPPLAPTEAHRPPLVAVLSQPRRSSRSRGWNRTAPWSTDAGCSSVPNHCTNRPVVSPWPSSTCSLPSPASSSPEFGRSPQRSCPKGYIASLGEVPGTFLWTEGTSVRNQKDLGALVQNGNFNSKRILQILVKSLENHRNIVKMQTQFS
jgi:hypothetical protein